jgi:copper oxidase (laccase) domain-containing protein
MIEVASGVVRIVEPHAEILYGGIAVGNVDTRPQFGEDAEMALQTRRDFVGLLRPEHYVLQVVGLSSNFLDLGDIATENLAHAYRTDGLIIDRPNVALGLNPADCNAVTMYDAAHGTAMGLIHVGRQGVDGIEGSRNDTGNIHLKALAVLTGKYAVAKENVRIHFAPSIRADSYAYPSIDPKQLLDRRWQGFIEQRESGNYHMDLVGRVVRELKLAGIDPEQIDINPIDTGTHTGYFSHVRSKQTGEPQGRNAVVAVLR